MHDACGCDGNDETFDIYDDTAIFTVASNQMHSPNNVYNRYYFHTCLTARHIATCCVK